MSESLQVPLYRRGRLAGVATFDADLGEEFLTYKWGLSGGYACRTVRRGETVSSAMHRQVCGLERGDPRVVHHINEDPLDNRRPNLEVCANMSAANCRPHPKRDAASRAGFAAYLRRTGLRSHT